MLLEATVYTEETPIIMNIITYVGGIIFFVICILLVRKYIKYKKHQSELLEEQNKLLKEIAEKDS